MRVGKLFRSTLAFFAVATLVSCSSSVSVNSNPGGVASQGHGNVAVIVQDAPLASVISFHATLQSLTATDSTTTVDLLTQPQDIEFARLTGLRTLLDLKSVPAGSYTSVSVMLMDPMISFLNPGTSPPSIQTISGSPAVLNVTVPLNAPLIVTTGDLIALLFDFNLGKSLQLDATGMVTGTVMPSLRIKAIAPDAPEADIDELRGGIVSVDAANGSFVIQLPNGRMLTVVTDASTEFEPAGDSLGTLDTNTIVEVSGLLDRATLTLHANEVDVVSHDHFVADGLLTDVRPPTGAASQMDLFVRGALPALANLQPGSIATFNLSGNELFFIRRMPTPLALFVFNDSALVRGQRVSVGGKLNVTPLALRRGTLYPQGLGGTWVPGSTSVQSGNQGTFQFNVNGLVGVLFNRPVTVLSSARTRFLGGLSGLGGLTGAQPIKLRVVGLVLKDPNTGNPTVVARAVELLP